jgi:chemotaxis protein methyltransferase CheR
MRYFVDKRVLERMRVNGVNDFRDYMMSLRGEEPGGELEQLVNAMTVNETYFFRETYQFDCMVRDMLGEIVRNRAPGSRIRIWSVPSSTGEEPYSIAIYLLERWPLIDDFEVEILSSDIDTNAIATAQRGLYAQRSVANLPDHYLCKYFTKQADGLWAISRDLVAAVEFSRVNLSDPCDTGRPKGIDLVFCRNLLIYFDDASRRTAIESLYETLNPGGFLCLGHSESMSRISTAYTTRRFTDAMVYQKPVHG